MVCGKRAAKFDLSRFIWREGRLCEDLEQKANGRGIYVCRTLSCGRRLCVSHKKLARALRCPEITAAPKPLKIDGVFK
ncbi:YlxR family protein [Desulfobacterota bacterium M19]